MWYLKYNIGLLAAAEELVTLPPWRGSAETKREGWNLPPADST